MRGDGCEIPHTVRCLPDPDGAAALRDLIDVAPVDQRKDHENRRGEEKELPQVDAVLAGVGNPYHLIHAGAVLDVIERRRTQDDQQERTCAHDDVLPSVVVHKLKHALVDGLGPLKRLQIFYVRCDVRKCLLPVIQHSLVATRALRFLELCLKRFNHRRILLRRHLLKPQKIPAVMHLLDGIRQADRFREQRHPQHEQHEHDADSLEAEVFIALVQEQAFMATVRTMRKATEGCMGRMGLALSAGGKADPAVYKQDGNNPEQDPKRNNAHHRHKPFIDRAIKHVDVPVVPEASRHIGEGNEIDALPVRKIRQIIDL